MGYNNIHLSRADKQNICLDIENCSDIMNKLELIYICRKLTMKLWNLPSFKSSTC